ncbi:MAG TPA: hypothetical protein VIK30_06490 [Polyangia bacterium]
MPRSFVSQFLLPLCRGGALHVGRPLGERAVARLLALAAADPDPLVELAAARRELAARHLPTLAAPPLDEITIRLGAALHNLLALGHPDLAGPGLARRQERIAESALALAAVAPPPSARETVNRHSLLARLPEIVRVDSTVRYWIGRQTFVGQTPPRRVTALPALRRVRVDRTRRSWLREIGIPAVGRRAFLALNAASPLGEALDPLRLDPPIGWGRILPILRFRGIARVVAGGAVELGVDRAGDALAGALYRFAGFHDPPFGLPASSEGVAFALAFLAHLVWLDVLYGAGRDAANAGHAQRNVGRMGHAERSATGKRSRQSDASAAAHAAAAASSSAAAGAADAGLELAVALTAAARARPSLVWPADVPRTGDLGRAFRVRLDAMAARADAGGASNLAAATGIAEFALAPAGRPLAL